jgi:uncharacterized membrane protein
MPVRCPDYRFLRICGVAAILLLGVFFRFTHLDTKPYWHDEAYTSLWMSGFDPSQGVIELFDGRVVAPEDMLRYQHLRPRAGIGTMLRTMARNDPHHPPLYYTLAWLWARCWDDSTTGLRAVAACFGLLLLPATFWLCAEALRSTRAAWLGTLFVAVSPVHLIYSQEAREYSLWALMVVVSSAALLRARRLMQARWWALYFLTTLAGLYSHGLFPLVMFAHGVWVVGMAVTLEWRRDPRGRRLFAGYLMASIAAAALYSPWLWNIWHHRKSIQECTEWMKHSMPLGQYLAILAVPAFVFGTVNPEDGTLWSTALGAGTAGAILLVTLSLVLGWRYRRRSAWLLAVALCVLPVGVLATPDLLWGGQRCFSPRFHFPCYVGVTLAMVHLLKNWLQASHPGLRFAGRAVVTFLLTLGIVTCATIWNADTWWNKRFGWHHRILAIQKINAGQRPLILSGPIDPGQIGDTLAFSHLLHDHVRLQVVTPATFTKNLLKGFTDVYVVNLPEDFRTALKAQWRLDPLDGTFCRCRPRRQGK